MTEALAAQMDGLNELARLRAALDEAHRTIDAVDHELRVALGGYSEDVQHRAVAHAWALLHPAVPR